MIATPGPSRDHVLHLLAPPSSSLGHNGVGRLIPTLLCTHTFQTAVPVARTLVTIGDESSHETARSLGLAPSQHLHPTSARGSGMTSSIVQSFPSASHVVCWNDELAPIADSLGLPCDFVSTKPERHKGRIHPRTAIRVSCERDLKLWESRGASCTLSPEFHEGHQGSFTNHDQRIDERRALGISESTLCIGAFEDNPSDVDARQFAFLLGLLSVAGYDVVGMLPENAFRRTQAVRHHIGLGRPFRMLWTSSPLTSALNVLDACIIAPGSLDGSSLLLTKLLKNAGVTPIDLSTSGPRGFSRSQRVAAKILDQIDTVREQLHERNTEQADV